MMKRMIDILPGEIIGMPAEIIDVNGEQNYIPVYWVKLDDGSFQAIPQKFIPDIERFKNALFEVSNRAPMYKTASEHMDRALVDIMDGLIVCKKEDKE